MSWKFWIDRELGFATGYDEMLEAVTAEFKVAVKNREPGVVDRRQYIVKWFRKNQWKFNRYSTLAKASQLLGLKTHCGLNYLNNHRKPSKNYEKNTKLVAEFLKNY